ncbi:MAG: hypothetical protein U9N59_00585 [Campylobacterota bacterium]|nr:hypothetical protein [Campylobacterota bacterium]
MKKKNFKNEFGEIEVFEKSTDDCIIVKSKNSVIRLDLNLGLADYGDLNDEEGCGICVSGFFQELFDLCDVEITCDEYNLIPSNKTHKLTVMFSDVLVVFNTKKSTIDFNFSKSNRNFKVNPYIIYKIMNDNYNHNKYDLKLYEKNAA